jgi:hypothetical protein
MDSFPVTAAIQGEADHALKVRHGTIRHSENHDDWRRPIPQYSP